MKGFGLIFKVTPGSALRPDPGLMSVTSLGSKPYDYDPFGIKTVRDRPHHFFNRSIK
jgi:hypothetical protein